MNTRSLKRIGLKPLILLIALSIVVPSGNLVVFILFPLILILTGIIYIIVNHYGHSLRFYIYSIITALATGFLRYWRWGVIDTNYFYTFDYESILICKYFVYVQWLSLAGLAFAHVCMLFAKKRKVNNKTKTIMP